MTDRDFKHLWEEINDQRVLFHPTIAPDGRLVLAEFFSHRTDLSIIVDNNILIDLIRLCRNGRLKDTERMRSMASFMLWVEINRLSVSSGQALQEKAAHIDSATLSYDFSTFKNIWSAYSPQQWQLLRRGDVAELPTIDHSSVIESDMSKFIEKPDAYYHAYSSVLKIVTLLRDSKYDGFQRAKAFIEWSYNNLTISKYTIAYGLLLLMGKENGVKAPKKAFSVNFADVLLGCENQAWDLESVSSWSQLLAMKDQGIIPDIYIFATRDDMLKRIIMSTIKSNDMLSLFQHLFNKKELIEILNLISRLQTQDRLNKLDSMMKSDYLHSLAFSEEENLKKIMGAS